MRSRCCFATTWQRYFRKPAILPGSSMTLKYPVIAQKNLNIACMPAFEKSVLQLALLKKPQHYNKGFWTPEENIIACLPFLTILMFNQPTTKPNNHWEILLFLEKSALALARRKVLSLIAFCPVCCSQPDGRRSTHWIFLKLYLSQTLLLRKLLCIKILRDFCARKNL